ncbi:MAG: hypothetical protein AMJ46_06530 [Latescibacteria bacterium DG_63]|nr:MAG: hypothetical protein AMJ46_06530 [Latescibacteria bacterium DG_63]
MKEDVRVLVVDDELIMRDSLSDWLREDGYNVVAVEDGPRALEKVKAEEWDVLIVDLKMPGMDGIEVMREVKKLNKEIPVIIMTAYATVDTAVRAMKEGAYDYIVKPFNPEEIGLTIRKIVNQQRLIRENIYLRQELRRQFQFKDIITKNPKMQKVLELVRSVAKTASTVLIEGESGTGKELIARAIHSCSARRKNPFVAVSCAALPETLLETELFGHEKGAFTGAIASKKGRFELADKGTVFLDEIGEISLQTQVKLLRFLEEKEFTRIGGTKPASVDVRILSATNKNLGKLVGEEKFREDLYYRLNVVCIKLPPLRERMEDIPLLTEHFLEKYRIENDKEIRGISEEAMELLLRYGWPGNVRELENAIESAVVVTKGSLIEPQDLPGTVTSLEEKGYRLGKSKSLHDMEKEYISYMLEACGWNVKKCAETLGIDRTTLYNRMKKYRLKKC